MVPGRKRLPAPEEWAIGIPVVDPIPTGFTKQAFTDSTDVIYWTRIFPPSFESAKAFFEAGANEYQLEVRVSAEGRITGVVFRVEQHPHSTRNFAPRGAPAWVFGDGALFFLDWDDIAPAAKHLIDSELLRLADFDKVSPAPLSVQSGAGKKKQRG